jgi:hypothetical protein
MWLSPRHLLAIVLAMACGSSPGEPNEGPIPPDDRGTLVSLGEPLATGFVWSADSREVFVFTRRSSGPVISYRLRAYDPVTQAQRAVGDSPAFPENFRASETGQWFYYSSFVSSSRDIFRVPQQGGSPEHVTAAGPQPGFAVSGDTRYVAYVSARDVVTVFDATDQTRRTFVVTDALAVLVMAPDASEIAVISGLTSGNAIDILTTADGTVRRAHTRQNPSPGGPPIAVAASWKDGALHLLFMAVDQSRIPTLYERNMATEAQTNLGTLTSVDGFEVETVSWVPETSRATVLVRKECLRSSGPFAPCLRRYEVFVVGGGQARLGSTANLPETGASSAVSPDGRWLAVGSMDGGLSVKELTP